MRRLGRWLLVAALLAVPFGLYLSMSPRFRWTGLLLPAFPLAAGWAVVRGLCWAAWILLTPVIALLGWLMLASVWGGT